MRSRRLVEFLLFSLSKVGWHLSSSCELPGRDRDTLFFKQGPPVPRAYFSVAFDEENTHSIKMIDAPNDAKQVFLDTLSVSLNFHRALCLFWAFPSWHVSDSASVTLYGAQSHHLVQSVRRDRHFHLLPCAEQLELTYRNSLGDSLDTRSPSAAVLRLFLLPIRSTRWLTPSSVASSCARSFMPWMGSVTSSSPQSHLGSRHRAHGRP